MSSKRERQSKDKNLKTIIAAVAGLILGYYILEYIAPWSTAENVPPGQTFYIVAGCVIIAVAALVLFYALKKRYFPKKKRRKSSRPVFLKDSEKKKTH